MTQTTSLSVLALQLSVDFIVQFLPFGSLIATGLLCILVRYIKLRHFLGYLAMGLTLQFLSGSDTWWLWLFDTRIMVQAFLEAFIKVLPVICALPYCASFILSKTTNIYKRLAEIRND